MKENNKGLAIAGLVISIVSIFIFPILGILSIIFGAIVINTNENKEPWFKPVWKYKNKTLGYGRYSLLVGIIDIVWVVINYFILMAM